MAPIISDARQVAESKEMAHRPVTPVPPFALPKAPCPCRALQRQRGGTAEVTREGAHAPWGAGAGPSHLTMCPRSPQHAP